MYAVNHQRRAMGLPEYRKERDMEHTNPETCWHNVITGGQSNKVPIYFCVSCLTTITDVMREGREYEHDPLTGYWVCSGKSKLEPYQEWYAKHSQCGGKMRMLHGRKQSGLVCNCEDGPSEGVWVRTGRTWEKLSDLPGRIWDANEYKWIFGDPIELNKRVLTDIDRNEYAFLRDPELQDIIERAGGIQGQYPTVSFVDEIADFRIWEHDCEYYGERRTAPIDSRTCLGCGFEYVDTEDRAASDEALAELRRKLTEPNDHGKD